MAKPEARSDYDQDFNQWLEKNVALLKAGQYKELDAANIAEELESMGKRDKRQLVNRMIILLAHLIKWHYQPGAISSSWKGTIIEQRRRLLQLLSDSPSLKPLLEERLNMAWQEARKTASAETGQPMSTYPEVCPWELQTILRDEWYPE